MPKLSTVLVASIVVVAAVAVMFAAGGPGRFFGSQQGSCAGAPTNAISWVETSVIFQRSGSGWIGTIEQTEVADISTFTPHCVEPVEDRLEDFGNVPIGTWSLTGVIKTTDQLYSGREISSFSLNGISVRHGASNLGGELIIHAGPTFFTSETKFRTMVTASLHFGDASDGYEETTGVSTFIEGMS